MSGSEKTFNMMEGLPERPDHPIYLDNNATTSVAPEVVKGL